MDSPKSPPGSMRRGGRNISHPLPRRSTKGPLDTAEDPLSAGSIDQQKAIQTEPQVLDNTNRPQVQAKASKPRASADVVQLPPSLRFLQNPALYHRIPTEEVPQAFLISSNQPSADTVLSDLLSGGHYRRAAEVALHELLDPKNRDAHRLLQLLHCRLACLTIISRPDIAADEAVPLLDFLTSNALGTAEVIDLVPWALRLLLIRLQSIGAQDGGRRTVMALYGLAAEARSQILEARDAALEAEVHMWSERLVDVGLRVSDTLAETGELETARRHLDSLSANHNAELSFRKVLLLLRLGDVASAERATESLVDERRRIICETLIGASKKDAVDAAQAWQASAVDDNSLQAQNKAVYLLYSGRIDEAISTLETLVRDGQAFHTLLSNLSTLYELTNDDPTKKKLDIIQQLSSVPSASSSAYWERTVLDFKL